MQVYPNRLAQHVKKNDHNFYMVFGDEPLQKMLSIEAIRKQALQQGFDERQQLTVDNQFQWSSLIEATQTLSLFSSKQFIELELPTGKPGTEGSKVLCELAANSHADTIVLIHGQKIGRDVQNAKWFKALDKQGIYVPCFALEGKQLQQWVAGYMNETGLKTGPESIKLLSDYCEGNLLAAKQEIDKLLLLYPNGVVTEQQIIESVVDQSRFNVFQLVDVMLSGDADRMVKMLYRLEAEGVEPTIVCWALTREWQVLSSFLADKQAGKAINWNQHRIWKNRQGFYMSALQRISLATLDNIQQKLQILDQRIKQSQVMRPYVELCHLCLLFIPFDLTSIPLE
ncbi:DNA polymerase III subunit delta [Aliiglaciecola sp. 2_MG-2023]|uniref:DNA polymerase III subunit delta n=1 Tax=unclassified Aliiglaciecola TaxID=2593648 RepID=UPI0026E3AE1B|nr:MULTISPECIES: DNA polymerase III subunit delta [unclassified Aliiglaciecola]MDO6710406.1 DNA polymerase III subunit delta [Aliiglaciecola sp. 2_MG-2023]MDO6751729.1 DNA polymerase III subunit delta [Aliiglaciecola sp. 1_MG-2023]